MVVSLGPCSCRDILRTALREWTPTRSGFMLVWWSLRAEMENRMAVIISVVVTMEKGSFLVTLYSQIYNYMLPPLVRMWWTWHARALQGHRSEAKDSWCMVCPMRPLLLFVILSVAKYACRSRWRCDMQGSWQPPFQNPTSSTVNWFVRVARMKVPSKCWK